MRACATSGSRTRTRRGLAQCSSESVQIGVHETSQVDGISNADRGRSRRVNSGYPQESLVVEEIDEGRLGRVELDTVLAAAGHASQRAPAVWPAGLTDREVDVLRLISRGLANKQVAARLGISSKTVGHHIEHLYTKVGVSTRRAPRCSRWSTVCCRGDWARDGVNALPAAVPRCAHTHAMPTIAINDTTLYYERDGQGPAILFVHGMCGHADVWAAQAERFADRYTCVRYDRRGHTRSRRGTTAISVACHADDAAALIESLDLAPCLVVGSSSGGVIGVDLALRHAHLLRGLVSSEPPLFSLDHAVGQAATEAVLPVVEAAIARDGLRAGVDAFMSIVCTEMWSTLDEGRRDRLREQRRDRLHRPAVTLTSGRAGRPRSITTPALIIAGTTSFPGPRLVARSLTAALADARFVEIDSGHVPYLEQPDAFAHAVSVFATEVDRHNTISQGGDP